MNKETVSKLKWEGVVRTCAITVETAGNEVQANGKVICELSLENRKFKQQLFILERTPVNVVLGNDFLKSAGIIIDVPDGTYWHKDRPEEIRMFNAVARTNLNAMLMSSSLVDPSKEQREQMIQELLKEYDEVIGPNHKVGRCGLIKHEIKICGEIKKKLRPYKYSPPLEEEIDRQISGLKAHNMVRESNSEFAAPIVLVNKPGGKKRMTVDYRDINQITVPDSYPMVKVSWILRSLPMARYFAKCDMESFYWQIEMEEKSIPYTAFISHNDLLEWLVMPFGLRNASKTAQRLMTTIFRPYIRKFLYVYQDDVLIFSSTFAEHLEHIRMMLQKLKDNNLTCNYDKCKFAEEVVQFLGVLITRTGIKVDPSKTAVILNLDRPTTRKQISQFHGMANYYSDFIERFAERFEPMFRLLKKKSKFEWGEEQEKAFIDIKTALAKEVILAGIDYTKPIICRTDASDIGLSATISQVIGGGERPVCYASRVLQPSEKNLYTMEKELLAIIWGLEKFREYLYGVEFYLFTDNSALTYLNNMRHASKKLTRWALSIQSWNINIRHCPGKDNKVADYLSRYPDKLQGNETDWVNGENNIIYTPTLCALIGSHFDLHEVKIEQQKDSSNIMDEYKGKDVCIHNGILCEKINGNFIVILPKRFRGEVMYLFHDTPECGHLGISKTMEKISSRFTWQHMKKDITEYVKSCEVCQKYKHSYTKPKGLLQHVKAKSVFDTICVDFLGPYPKSRGKGNQFILIVTCAFSHWVELFPMRHGKATNVAEKLEDEVFCRFGSPRIIISDNGTAFRSKIMKTLCQEWKITLKTTSSHNPKANFAERMNRNLVTMMASFVKSNHTTWDRHLQKFALAMRTMTNRVSGVTPALLNLGREIALPIDRQMHNEPQEDPAEVAAALPEKLKEIVSYVNTCMDRARAQNKVYFDRTRVNFKLKVGDMAFIRNHPFSSSEERKVAKFYPKWLGPYKVLEELTPVSYRLEVNDCKILDVQHIQNLKPFYKRNPDDKGSASLSQIPADKQIPSYVPPTTRKRKINFRQMLGLDK